MEEIWKPVVGYEGLYEVSNLGRIKAIRFGEKIMKLRYDKHNYLLVGLTKNNKYSVFLVHRIVLKSFIGLPKNGEECDHINRQRDDNRLENLRWVTRSKNQLNKTAHGKSKFKGVSYNTFKYSRKDGTYGVLSRIRSSIKINNNTVLLGYFETEEEAYRAYKTAFRNHYGYDYID
jgi:hypothetical protein